MKEPKNIMAERQCKCAEYAVEIEGLKTKLRKARSVGSRLRKLVDRLKVCFCIDKTRNCLRCQTPFDPSWSHWPSIEQFCDAFCRTEHRRMHA